MGATARTLRRPRRVRHGRAEDPQQGGARRARRRRPAAPLLHIGTGNYNAKTARIYEDLGFLTCDPDIGDDVAQLFNHLTGYSRADDYRNLLVAPRDLRRQLVDLIEHEASFGPDGHITLKCNSIADDEMIETLYAASAAGTRIDIMVRGICCLRAGVPGMSETIRVRSILGRYLEHSRIYRFAHGNVVARRATPDATSDAVYLIGSADLMPRNLNRRVEVHGADRAPPAHRARSTRCSTSRSPTTSSRWELQPDDTWTRVGPTGLVPAALAGADVPLDGRPAAHRPHLTLGLGLRRHSSPERWGSVHLPFTCPRARCSLSGA